MSCQSSSFFYVMQDRRAPLKNANSLVCIEQTLLVVLISSLSSAWDYIGFPPFGGCFYLIYANRCTAKRTSEVRPF